MAGKKGYAATRKLRTRAPEKRGGNRLHDLPTGVAGSLARQVEAYLQHLAVKNHTPATIEGRRDALKVFLLWAGERDLTDPAAITKPILESYQRHLWRWKKKNGKPLGISTQRSRLGTLKDFFAYLSKGNHIPANPASELELPRQEKRLPQEALGLHEVKAVLNVPDILDPLGLRDRTILELFYSTGMRRGELSALEITDLNRERQTLQIRQGKGRKDRVVPVGDRALHWLERYLEEVRPRLLLSTHEKALFVTSYGEAFNPDVLSRKVSKYIKTAEIGRKGSCHLFRHSCATHMLEGGADIRFIQQLLGHEKLETTSIYTHVSIEQLKAVHSKTHPAEAKK
ncbi:MAG: site-specific tyrosine recombinase XerC [Opitutales bacterium]